MSEKSENKEELGALANLVKQTFTQHVAITNVQESDEERVGEMIGEKHHARLFTELQEFEAGNPGKQGHWKETARWVKFEEDIEAGADRWSKPHVGTVSMHAVNEIEAQIKVDKERIILDFEADNTDAVISKVIELIQTEHPELPDDEAEKINSVLHARHNHEGTQRKRNKFLKKVEDGAESCEILVAEFVGLDEIVTCLVRLAKPILPVDSEMEVDIPIRFYCFVIGPESYKNQLHEIGRALGVLMADDVFHEVAYEASNADDILSGLHEFLDKTWLLPPDEWDPSIRIEPPALKKDDRREHLRQRRVGQSAGIAFGDGGFKASEHDIGPELQRTGRFCGGLIDDIKRKAPFIANGSDLKDAFNLQCLATFIFLYFAVLTPIVTFGGLLGDATDNKMAAMESIFGGAIAGGMYHLFSGQPLTIIGSTGPILVFETIMSDFCKENGMEYLEFRWWVGFWTGLMCIIIVVTDGSFCVQYITRYTEESFATLISLIFIVDGFKKIAKVCSSYPVNYEWSREDIFTYDCSCTVPVYSQPTWDFNASVHNMAWFQQEAAANVIIESQRYEPNTTWSDGQDGYFCIYKNNAAYYDSATLPSDGNLAAETLEQCLQSCGVITGDGCAKSQTPYTPNIYYFSWFLCLGTLALSFFFKFLFTSPFGPSWLRKLISDFAVIMAIIIMVGVDLGVGLKDTPKLFVPSTFVPTRSDRGWWISPIDKNEPWTIGLAIAFALLATILIFMDQQITTVIVNRKENKLTKGCGYHLDLLIVAIALMVCSFCGLPWFVAATVLSITHVNSLKRYDAAAAPGETPQFSGVYEQRITGLLIFLLIGLSVFFTPILGAIPLPVLYGVFIYMGISSLRGNQFFDRILLFFMPAKFQPDYTFLRHVKLMKVHLFTLIQVLCFGILYAIKSIPQVSIAFPIMVVAIVGVRKSFDWCPAMFSQRELSWLDDTMPEADRRDDDNIRRSRVGSSSEEMEKRETVMNRMKSYIGSIFYSRKSKVAPNIDLRRSVATE